MWFKLLPHGNAQNIILRIHKHHNNIKPVGVWDLDVGFSDITCPRNKYEGRGRSGEGESNMAWE